MATDQFVEIDVGGYEGNLECPNCGNKISVKQGNNSDTFTCERYDALDVGCGAVFKVYGKVVEEP